MKLDWDCFIALISLDTYKDGYTSYLGPILFVLRINNLTHPKIALVYVDLTARFVYLLTLIFTFYIDLAVTLRNTNVTKINGKNDGVN